MFSALYQSAPKVSGLQVLLVGVPDSNLPGVISFANALTGGQFSKDRWGEKQKGSVVAGAGRRLNVTYMPYFLFIMLGEAVTAKRATDLDINIYHCVIIVMSFYGHDSSPGILFNRVVVQPLAQRFGENFLKKRCLIVVTGADKFAKARDEGIVTKSFIEWCRERTPGDKDFRPVFYGVQERWLLFDTDGPPDVLKSQREELIDMIDGRVLGRHFHTHIKLEEVEEKTQRLDSQVSELKGFVQKDTTKIEVLQKSLVKETDRALELEKQLTHVKKQVQRDQAEIEKKLQMSLTKSTDRVLELENQFTHVKEHGQSLRSEISQIKETIHDVSLQAMERPQNLENQMADFKQYILKQNTDIKELKTNSTKADNTSQEMGMQLKQLIQENTELKGFVQKDTTKIEQLQKCLIKATDRALELEKQLTHVKKHGQNLSSEISQIKETIHDVSLQAVESPQNLENQLANFKQRILKQNTDIRELKTDLTKTENTSQEMGIQLKQLIQENTELKQHLQNVSLNTTETLPEVKHQLQQLRERLHELHGDVQTIKDGNGHALGRSLWNSLISLLSLARLQTSPRLRVVVFLLVGLLVLGLVSLVLHAPGTWVTTTTSRREITSGDDGLHLRRYLDSELKETTRRLKDMDMRISELKVHVLDKPRGSDLNDSDGAAKRRLEMEKQLEELREQVLNETAQQADELRKILEEKSCGRGTNLWEMIRSLPVSLPLIISLTVTLLSLGTIPLPVPLAALFTALLGSLLILQLLLLLVLFGA